MRSVKRLVVVVVTIAALVLVVSPAAAATNRAFHLDKTCAGDTTEPLGYICTVAHSDFKWIPAGTDIRYLSQNEAGDVVQASITIRNGSTNGVCVWSGPVNAVCTFSPGSGRLAQFHLVVDVTANADQSVWYWDGSYWFGG
jgi:hypothetical protein